jgi:putative ABC transport system permease protein
MTGFGVNVVSLHADVVSPVRRLIIVLFAGAGLVLLIACANIANLLLARAMAREREMAVRGALGAGRGRIVRQLLTESAVLGAAGGVAGVLAAFGVLRVLLALAPRDIPLLDRVHLDPAALAFAAAASIISVAIFGLVPAFRLARAVAATGAGLQATLRSTNERSGGSANARLRSTLLVGEVALSLVLLTSAGLLIRSSLQLARVDYGFRPADLLIVSLDLPAARYDSAGQIGFFARTADRLRSVHGVVGATAMTDPPAGSSVTFSFAIEGRPSPNASGREDPEALRVVTPDYFRVMGIPLIGGRAFEERDRADAPPVVMVNQTLARKHWPNESPVGKRISLAGADGPWMEIVGVAGDTRLSSADQPPAPALYMPHAQKKWRWMSWLTIGLRVSPETNLTAIAPAVRAAIWEIDPLLPIDRIVMADDLYRDSTARRRFAMVLLGSFATLALALGMIGMYGVLSYSVVQRSREIGIRMALGAQPREVMQIVLRQALAMTALGLAIGLVVSLAGTRVLRSLLYEVSPTDVTTFVLVGVLLGGVASVAAWLPARRATRIDPLMVLREA